jgi:hypothetical protein
MQWKEKQVEDKVLCILNMSTDESNLSYLCSGEFTPNEARIDPATPWLTGWMIYISDADAVAQ